MLLPIRVLGFLLFSLLATAHADTILLNNGDRLSGKIVLIDSGKLLLKTNYAGTISIATSKITSIETQNAMQVREDRFKEPLVSILQPSTEGSVLLAVQQADVAITDIYQATPVAEQTALADWVWSGNIDLSGDFKRKESSSDNYEIDLQTELRHSHWRHNAELSYDYETKDDSKKTDTFMASYTLDRFFSERWFWQAKYRFNYDGLEDLRKQHLLGTGPGFQFWDDSLGSLSMSALFNHSQFQYENGHKERFQSATWNWDYRRFFWARTLEFYNKAEIGIPFTSDISYVLDAETGLRYRLNSWASLSLRAEWDKVRSRFGNLNDRRYLIGVGVNW